MFSCLVSLISSGTFFVFAIRLLRVALACSILDGEKNEFSLVCLIDYARIQEHRLLSDGREFMTDFKVVE